MKVSIVSSDVTTSKVDLICLGVFKGKNKGNAAWEKLNKLLDGALADIAKEHDFSGKAGQSYVVHTLGRESFKRVMVIGCGEADKMTPRTIQNLGANAARHGNKVAAKKMTLILPDLEQEPAELVDLITRGAYLGSYRYDKYRSKSDRANSLKSLGIDIGERSSKKLSTAIEKGRIVAESVAIGRDLINEPPSDLYPETFAGQAKAMARKVGLKVKIYKPEQLKKMGMNLLLGVGQGSVQSPRLVHLTYTPDKPTSKKPIVFVGKGITFDSGGLCLKPAGSMMDMKMDMGGAAAVVGAMNAIAQLKPNTPVHGILALAENMPSGEAIRMGDVITGASGRTVEVNNTDAEGRLVLADALHYASGLKPAQIIDLATLTGACLVALGPHTVGLFSNDDKLADSLLSSAESTGESFWRLPLNEMLSDQLKSDLADTKNTGERYGGAITAALFLKEFVNGVPWAHLDIAGPAMNSSDSGYLTKGGSGVGVATLVDHVC